MKKVLSLFLMATLAIGAWATEVTDVLTLSLTGMSGSSYDNWSGKTSNSDAVYAGNSAGGNEAIQLRSNNSNSGIITTASGGTVKKIVVTWNSNTANGRALDVYGKNVAYTSPTELYATGGNSAQGTKLGSIVYGTSTTLEVTGDYTFIGLRSNSGAMYLDKIEITWETEAPSVATPVISGTTPFTESTEVTITCATTGASIYYTLDGTAPTNASTPYTAAFPLTETKTVKAIAYLNGTASSVATKEFEKKAAAATCATVAEFNALADDTEFTFGGTLIVGGQKGNYLYAQDETGGILIYGTIDKTYETTDVIPAGWTGKKTTYKGAPEATNPANFSDSETQADLAPEEMTPSEVTLANAFKYAVIKGATVTMTDANNGTITANGEEIKLYNKPFEIEVKTDGEYDIIGIVGFYNNPQFLPMEFVPVQAAVAAPVITGTTPFNGSTQVTITCETAGASIYYTLDGTDPTNESDAYTEPFTLTESKTVKAIAYDVTGTASSVTSMAFVKNPSTVAEYNALPDGTEFTFGGTLIVGGQKGNYLYAQDETGGILIFGSIDKTYETTDVIPAGWTGKKTTYKGAPEATNPANFSDSETQADLAPEEMTPSEVTLANAFKYAVIKGATVTMTDANNGTITANGEEIKLYNKPFEIEVKTDGEYDIIGIVGFYNNPQFLPMEFVEVVEPVESTITYEAEQENGTVTITLADGTPVESGVTKVLEGTKFTVAAAANYGFVVASIEVKQGDDVLTPDADGDGMLKAEGPRNDSQTYTMPAGDVTVNVSFQVKTGIENLNMDNVKSVRYYNLQGVESATPFDGMNIMVREMTDGSKVATKVVK